MFRFAQLARKPHLKAAGAVAALLMAGSPAVAAAPPAAVAAPAKPYGTVIAVQGVKERQFPSTDSSVKGTLPHRAQIGLKCKVRAENVEGNNIWYLLRDRPVWVTARYVENTGTVRFCNEVLRSPLTDGKQAKHAKG
ncbi:hypothetical protein [Streptomyces sp. TP-A0874]|uniref:hypothetical protein n=1 Tax=Streptomyces sp. TP-A0874 TaxID=549819 RepID=UPI0008534C12|nr:hypothetical protein [Streptomyces sp. TP-A0874]